MWFIPNYYFLLLNKERTEMTISVNTQEATVLVQDCMNVGLVPLLKGSPGTKL